MTADDRARELERLAAEAHEAERTGHAWAAGEVWKRYVLVCDGGRDPDELLAEGVELSRIAITFAEQAERPER